MENKLLGARLKTIRQQKKLTIEQLSQKSGISVATICNIENANIKPYAITLSRLCVALDIDLEQINKEK